jgi:hypothetical protein
MKAALALYAYAMVCSLAQVEMLPASLPTPQAIPQTPGLKVPLPPVAAQLAAPRPESHVPDDLPPIVLPMKVSLPEPRRPAELATPMGEALESQESPAPVLPLPALVYDTRAENTPRPVPVVPLPPMPSPSPAQNQMHWKDADPAQLRPAGPAAGCFVIQDVHGFWPPQMTGAATVAPPPALESAATVVRASSHALPAPAPILPVIYTSRSVSAQPAKKMRIVSSQQPEIFAPGAQDNYRKIVGSLTRVHIHKGCWVVRYSGLDKEDRYGGSVVLESSASLTGFAEGDFVCVQGELLNGGRAERPLGAPLYRVQSIQRVGGPN